MGCLSVNITRVNDLTAILTRDGGIKAEFRPVCTTDIHGRVVYLLDNDGEYLLDSENKKLKTNR